MQIPEYEVYLHKVAPDGGSLAVIYHLSGSFSLSSPRLLGKHVVFCDGRDIVAIEA
jgi:hypothetical protein